MTFLPGGLMRKCLIHIVAGARPNLIKIGPLYRTLVDEKWCDIRFIWVAQHTDKVMSEDNYHDVGLDTPSEIVEIAQDGFGPRLGEIITGMTMIFERQRPDLLVVAGDVDTSLAASIAARRMMVPIAHLEAGLRSYDNSMPEESNRILVDAISDIWLAPSEAARDNLVKSDGHPAGRVHFVGNIMIDSLKRMLDPAHKLANAKKYGLSDEPFGIVTFHRPANVDSRENLKIIADLILKLAKDCQIFFPVHPRTRKNLAAFGFLAELENEPNLRMTGPLVYREFVNLLAESKFVVTDSGGLQEEAAYLKKLCFTVRDNTERPATIYCGSNTLVPLETAGAKISMMLADPALASAIQNIELWDGYTAHRTAHVLQTWWQSQPKH